MLLQSDDIESVPDMTQDKTVLSLLKGAKFSVSLLNAWLELKTNGCSRPFGVSGPPYDGRRLDHANVVASADAGV